MTSAYPVPLSKISTSDSISLDQRVRKSRLSIGNEWVIKLGSRSESAPSLLRNNVVPATVPGCVHTDLLAAGLIDDPLIELNDRTTHWIGDCDWQYICRFTLTALDDADRIDLVCEGLDTLATLRLNGQEVGQSSNMHVGQRFNVSECLRVGLNELIIDFAAPLPFSQEMAERFGQMPCEGFGSNPRLPHNMMRKYACNFGWDWGPALPTAGIWRPIYLEKWSNARLASVRPGIAVAAETLAVVDVVIDLDRHGSLSMLNVESEIADPEGQVVATQLVGNISDKNTAAMQLRVTQPRRWWPLGYGKQPLYQLTVRIKDEAGQLLDTWQKPIGLRTVELVTRPDEQPARADAPQVQDGSTFYLAVNGQRIFCKGANWIPDDCFPSQITAERYQDAVKLAADANMNMLRVWGGGIYEDHAFYEACDAMGVMVWQDFCCACATYPETEPFTTWFEDEARYNVSRLAHHASLVLWCGNNECNQAVEQWGKGFERYRGADAPAWGLGYYTKLFPAIVAELDPTRPYWPGSPYSPSPGVLANAEHEGDTHIWDVWNGQGNARNYLTHTPRFASEFGFHGPPTWPTLARAIPPEQRRFDSPMMVHHNRHAGGQPLADERMRDYFSPTSDFNDWLYLTQVVQARSLALGVEWFRALSPWCSGALYWQFNDCWPVSSWSAVDGDGRRKPLWYATRRFLASKLLTIRPADATPQDEPLGPLAVYLHNDSDQAWDGELTVTQLTLDGQVLRKLLTTSAAVTARDKVKVELPTELDRQENTFLMAQMGEERAFWFFKPDYELAYPIAQVNGSLEQDGTEYRLHLRAESFVRDLCVFADRLDPDALVSDQLLTLLPGDEATVVIVSKKTLTLAELMNAPVMQSVNRFGCGE